MGSIFNNIGNSPAAGIDNIFGKSQVWVGTSNRDLILKTKGKVKVLWANKFIDIIKDGKLNIDVQDPFRVYQTESEIDYTLDGLIFVVDEGAFYLLYNGKLYPLTTSEGEFVSFKETQITSTSDKQRALNNIGFLYSDESEVQNALQDGLLEPGMFVYILGDGLYMITDSGDLFNPYYPTTGGEITGKVIITTNESNALEIASGKNIKIGGTLYSNTGINFSSDFSLGDNFKFTAAGLTIDLVTTIREIISNYIHSSGFIRGLEGFGMYFDENGYAVIEADRVISRMSDSNSNIIDGTDDFYISQYTDIISLSDYDEDTFEATYIIRKPIFEVGDIGRIMYQEQIDDDEFDNDYDTYSYLFEKSYNAYEAGTTKYTADSIQKFLDVINLYNSDLPSPTAINPDDGTLVDITINILDENGIIYPDSYDPEEDPFDFNGKIIALRSALLLLDSIIGNFLDLTINEVDELEITVILPEGINANNLVYRKLFKIKGNFLRLHSNEDSSNFDFYTDIQDVNDVNDSHINTRIGDVTPFMSTIIGQNPIPSDYLNEGIFTRVLYVTGGILKSADGTINIDLTIPSNTTISAGIISNSNNSIYIDLNGTNQMSSFYGLTIGAGGINNSGLLTTAGIQSSADVNITGQLNVNGDTSIIGNTTIDGDLTVTGDVTSDSGFFDNSVTSSDIRLKSDIKNVDTNWINNISVKEYNKKGIHEAGVIAQEVKDYKPEFVREKNDIYYVDDKSIMYTMILDLRDKIISQHIDNEQILFLINHLIRTPEYISWLRKELGL